MYIYVYIFSLMGVFLGNLIRIRKSNTSAYANIFIGPNISKNILSSSSVLKKKREL